MDPMKPSSLRSMNSSSSEESESFKQKLNNLIENRNHSFATHLPSSPEIFERSNESDIHQPNETIWIDDRQSRVLTLNNRKNTSVSSFEEQIQAEQSDSIQAFSPSLLPKRPKPSISIIDDDTNDVHASSNVTVDNNKDQNTVIPSIKGN